ncbi:GntR family transcriptional regulator [Paenibacillus radicis (ex Gao et al. 2016)]|uniref:GntR family transcriptional regulator n=1 Tax=Paenibacillus radicis (ex Gao et al. 2016) TaxID=1737354 RepID=A0A917LWH2_9BACL|nr:GntR family transcriptional regulator [Paenibacillus radicis (ex Gao et al. 2016)]GGG62449.1 GntR family transcriptional regulator [Paenibacillus radicis (ex Gao et al. 2016)]
MWLPIQINEQSAEPLYFQIEVQLRALIVSGQLSEGTLLPSIRELAQMLKCSVITVRRVYQDLESEGLLRTRQGTGTYVARVEQREMDRHRLEAVIEAIEGAVAAGKLVQCSKEELADLFREALDKHYGV